MVRARYFIHSGEVFGIGRVGDAVHIGKGGSGLIIIHTGRIRHFQTTKFNGNVSSRRLKSPEGSGTWRHKECGSSVSKTVKERRFVGKGMLMLLLSMCPVGGRKRLKAAKDANKREEVKPHSQEV